MRLITLIFGLTATFTCFSQVSTSVLTFNNTKARITDGGFFFNDQLVNAPGYEVPLGSGTNIIYAGAFWFGGMDLNNQLKLAAPSMYGVSSDLWPGPITEGAAQAITPNPMGQTIWTVSQNDINNHMLSINQPGYMIPLSIVNWPANGDVSLGLSHFLAPFVDVDYDGVYNPANGDYPCIKGDKATYVIMNDTKQTHGSGGDPMGIEVHYMFYQFATNDYLDNTTFVDITVYNRGTQSIFDFKNSFMMDGDLGGPVDDFVGCDISRNIMYEYNSDADDASASGIQGYGLNPPAAGVVCLSHDMTSMITFNNGGVYPQSDPSTAAGSWNIMNGTWLDGSDVLDNNNQPTKFHYSGNPNNGAEWSELSQGNWGGDRRSIMSMDIGTLDPSEHVTISYAVLYDRSGVSMVDNVNGLLNTVDLVQAFYDTNLADECDPSVMSVNEVDEIEFDVYPNPSNGSFTIDTQINGAYDVSVLDMTGRKVYSKQNFNGKVTMDLNIPSGVYFVTINSDGMSLMKKLIIE